MSSFPESLDELRVMELDLVQRLEDVRKIIRMKEEEERELVVESGGGGEESDVNNIVNADDGVISDKTTTTNNSVNTTDKPPSAVDNTLTVPSEEDYVAEEEDHLGDYERKIACWKELGNKSFSEQDYDNAVKHYSRAINVLKKLDLTTEKQYVTIYANRSAAYLALKKWVAASWDAQCAVKCDSTFWKAHWRHGVSLMAMAPRIERSTNAVAAFENCLKYCPEVKKAEVEQALERARIRLKEGKDRTPMPPQCNQS